MSGRRLGHHVARFWLRPGVLWPVKFTVPHPPPREWEVLVAPPMPSVARRREDSCPVYEPPHTIRFRLTNYIPSGEVCHYELIPSSRPGWRYIFDGPRIIAERVGVRVTRRATPVPKVG